ncbi:MAG: PqqD family protein [Chloracidobacterium sp.]|nr:PqqD family protein [Chloracidobacterium sp.]
MNTNPNGLQNPIARQSGIVIQEINNEVLVYDLKTNRACCLNHSAAFIWKMCDGQNSITDIIRFFESEGLGKVTEDFVWLAIDQLSANGLLKNKFLPRFSGQSRRKVIQTIGLASMAAIPIIASLVAPPSAYASISNCVCTSSSQCAFPPNQNCPSTTNCNSLGLCAPNNAPRKI